MYVRKKLNFLNLFLLLLYCTYAFAMTTEFNKSRKLYYRDKIKSMFYHAYNGYLNHAYPLDELRPLTCTGMDTWGSFSLTLIDALDTLIIMGNHTEFVRAVELVLKNANVDENVNVSVFETNIRVVGGLLSAHMLSAKVNGYALHPGWPCAGPLLDLAERFAAKLLPAFNTPTGMPYGTVNLRYGVHMNETPVTCTACIGSFILEFGTLSRLTGNPHYERVALRALKALWESRSALGLVGNHINVQTGVWTATDAGIGAGIDSYFEYLVKGALFFQRPLLMHQFYEYEKAINQHIRQEDWFLWVKMTKGQVTFPIFQSLEAFYPSILSLIGKTDDAIRIMSNYIQILRQYGLPPEFYNLPTREAHNIRSGYPLRPEIIESLLYLYKATGDPKYLHTSAAFMDTIESTAKTKCGYATIRTVIDFTLEDRMESFFLSETAKYLYLIFDDENFIHNDGSTARIIDTTDGSCLIDAGGYIFNTEAHPLDPGIVYCCGEKRQNDTKILRRFEENIDLLSLLDLQRVFASDSRHQMKKSDLDQETAELDVVDEEVIALNAEKQRLMTEKSKKNEGDNLRSFSSSNTADSTKGKSGNSGNEEDETLRPLQSHKLADTAKGENAEKMDIGTILKEVIEKLRERKNNVLIEPFVQVLCNRCCASFHQLEKGSLALSRLASALYSQLGSSHLTSLRVARGPVCDARAVPVEPSPAAQFKNVLPDVSQLESEKQDYDAVSDFSFDNIVYRRLSVQRHNLLSSPSVTFLNNFLSVGQSLPVA